MFNIIQWFRDRKAAKAEAKAHAEYMNRYFEVSSYKVIVNWRSAGESGHNGKSCVVIWRMLENGHGDRKTKFTAGGDDARYIEEIDVMHYATDIIPWLDHSPGCIKTSLPPNAPVDPNAPKPTAQLIAFEGGKKD